MTEEALFSLKSELVCLGLTNDLNWILLAHSHKLRKSDGEFIGLLLDLVQIYSTQECEFRSDDKNLIINFEKNEMSFEALTPEFVPEVWVRQILNDPLKLSQMKIFTTKSVFQAHLESGPCTYFIRGECNQIPPPTPSDKEYEYEYNSETEYEYSEEDIPSDTVDFDNIKFYRNSITKSHKSLNFNQQNFQILLVLGTMREFHLPFNWKPSRSDAKLLLETSQISKFVNSHLLKFQMIRNCVRIRRLSEKGLYPTKESFLHSSVNRSRHEQVEKAVSSKVRIYKEGAHPSFITDEFFGKGSILILE